MAMRPVLTGTDPFGSMRISKRCHGGGRYAALGWARGHCQQLTATTNN